MEDTTIRDRNGIVVKPYFSSSVELVGKNVWITFKNNSYTPQTVSIDRPTAARLINQLRKVLDADV